MKKIIHNRMVAIIGTGISGSLWGTRFSNSLWFDKAKSIGGRIATKNFTSKAFCDIGATILSSLPVLIQTPNGSFSFKITDWLDQNSILYHPAKVYQVSGKIVLKNGTYSLCKALLLKKDLFMNHELQTIQKKKNKWELVFASGLRIQTPRIIITAPIPQALSFLQEEPVYEEWGKFLKPYSSYRSTLVTCGFWDKVPHYVLKYIENLKEYTSLDKYQPREYTSIESLKSQQEGNHLCFLIQYSHSFSIQNWDLWMDSQKNPTNFSRNQFQKDWEEFITTHNIPWDPSLPPNQILVHRWKYAQPNHSLFGKDGVIDFKKDTYLEYRDLVLSTNLQITGDWLYGPRIERIIAGIIKEEPFFEES